MGNKLGILAGGGDLPGRLIESCRASGREFYVIAIKDQADPAVIGDAPHTWIRLGAGQKALEVARREEIKDIVMVGPVKRPSIVALRPDLLAAKVLAKASASSVMGDDGLLRAVIHQIEELGFTVIGPEQFLQQEALTIGPLGEHAPDELALGDIKRGVEILNATSPVDIGQSVVVQDKIVIALEAVEGTDAMIVRSGPLRRDGPGGVLVKLPKAQQERRADMPTIGPVTVQQAYDAGLRGIAIANDATLLIDKSETLNLADRLGLFVYAINTSEW